MTVEDIKKAISGTDYEFYGLRKDEDIRYNVGNVANNSHQLYQDPWYDDDDELVYPYIENGPYAGFYDAGELDGTCTIGFDPDDDASIQNAINCMKYYCGETVHLLAGDQAIDGEDRGEKIIEDAEVLAVFERR